MSYCAVQMLGIDSTNLVEELDLVDQLGQVQTGATMQATVYEADGATPIGGVSWPVLGVHSANPDGRYVAVLPSVMQLTEDAVYKIEVVMSVGAVTLTQRINAVAEYA